MTSGPESDFGAHEQEVKYIFFGVLSFLFLSITYQYDTPRKSNIELTAYRARQNKRVFPKTKA